MEIEGRVALVTGAGRRIGRALALALARSGARVAVHYAASEAGARETVAAIAAAGGTADAFAADFTDPDGPARLVQAVLSRFGALEIIVNNASVFRHETLTETTLPSWEEHFAVHVRAPFLLAQAMLRALPEGAHGKIVNVVDWQTARPDRFAYGASKAALSGLTRSLAAAMAPNVQVNEVALGAVMRPDHTSPESRVPKEPELGLIPRLGTVDEVAAAVLALIENDYITGQTLYVDGGRHVRQ